MQPISFGWKYVCKTKKDHYLYFGFRGDNKSYYFTFNNVTFRRNSGMTANCCSYANGKILMTPEQIVNLELNEAIEIAKNFSIL